MNLTPEAFTAQMREVNPSIIPLGTYAGPDEPMQFYCQRCENTFTRPASYYLDGKHTKCPICCRWEMSYREIIEKVSQINPNVEIVGKITRTSGTVHTRCKVDGHEWDPYVHNLLKGQGCPVCGGKMKVSEEAFMKRLEEQLPSIEVIGKFNNLTTRIEVRCKKCGHQWNPIAQSLYQGHGCVVCAGKNKRTTEEIKAELAVTRPDVELLGEYHDPHERILYRFKECGHECLISTSHVKAGRGCPVCSKARRGEGQRGSKEKLQAELDKRFGDIEVVGNYVNTHTTVMLRCRRCGHEWEAMPMRLKKSHGCPFCHKVGTSFIQEFVRAFLSHAFPEGSVKSRDRRAIGRELDIYIPDARIAIEPGSWYWHQQNLESDREKRRLCDEAGIDLITLYDHYPDGDPPFPGAIVTKSDLGDPRNFKELVALCYSILARAGVHMAYSADEIEAIRDEAYRSSLGVTQDDFALEVSQTNPKITVMGEFRGENRPVLVRCDDCGYEWSPVASRLRRTAPCPRCTGHFRWTHGDFVAAMAQKHPHATVIGRYVNQNTKIKVRCNRRGVEKEYLPGYLLSAHCCRQCAGSSNPDGS